MAISAERRSTKSLIYFNNRTDIEMLRLGRNQDAQQMRFLQNEPLIIANLTDQYTKLQRRTMLPKNQLQGPHYILNYQGHTTMDSRRAEPNLVPNNQSPSYTSQAFAPYILQTSTQATQYANAASKKKKSKPRSGPARKRRNKSKPKGQSCYYPELECILNKTLTFLIQDRNSRLLQKQIRILASNIFKYMQQLNMYSPLINFNNSKGWLQNYLRRNKCIDQKVRCARELTVAKQEWLSKSSMWERHAMELMLKREREEGRPQIRQAMRNVRIGTSRGRAGKRGSGRSRSRR